MKRFKASPTIAVATVALVVASANAFQPTVDGTIAGDAYGPARAVQAVQTQFGDNQSELNAAYGTIESGRLYLALTGNLEANFNKLEIFIDSQAGGFNQFPNTMPGNDGVGVMTGLFFDTGFDADYHLIIRRGNAGGNDLFDVDMAILGTANFSAYSDIFGGLEGSAMTGTGPGNASPLEVAYNNANMAGVAGGTGAADQAAAMAVQTGLELSIALSDLGNPAGAFNILAFVNGSGHHFASNQFLGSLTPPQGNLGGDGNGNFTGELNIDLDNFAGQQWFTVPEPGSLLLLGAGLVGLLRRRA